MIPFVTHPLYSYAFDARHRFPMQKFKLLVDYLTQRNIVQTRHVFRPGRVLRPVLEQAHCPNYVQRFMDNQLSPQELRRMGLPWSEGLVRRTLISPNGTLLTALLALEHGIACHLAGGTHHAHRDFASGFCIFNDLAVAALALLPLPKVDKVLIFDCDVHQGDGTASMLADEPRVFTCSIHCDKNFPRRKAHSDLDVALPRGLADRDYLSVVTQTLARLLKELRPSLVLYDAGVDVYAGDPLGLLNISELGIRQRERQVLSMCQQAGIPVATVIGGGYDHNRHALAKRHAMVVEEAVSLFRS